MTSEPTTVLKAGAAMAGAYALGLSGIARGQADKIKIGHLTPLTGFLGALGDYALLGLRMAEEEINKAGGVMGRQLEIDVGRLGQSRHRRHQGAAHARARRRDRADGRDQLGLRADDHRRWRRATSACSCRSARAPTCCAARTATSTRFHVDIPNTVMVNAVGKALLRDNMVKGKKFFTLTADYVFGHDLLRAAKAFFAANEGNLIGDELVATDVTDFSPYLLKIRQAGPTWCAATSPATRSPT